MSNGYRQAALCLHGLGAKDRGWLLAQLTDEQRSELGNLLLELRTLGIPENQQWLHKSDPALQNFSDNQQEVLSAQEESRVEEVLAKADVKHIWSVLESETDSVIAALIFCKQWPWQSAIEKLYKKSRYRTLPKAKNLTPRLRKTLIDMVVSRLHSHNDIEHKISFSFRNVLRKLLWRR